ncbi:lanthionine synthetase LanC family protein [Dactylosporangium sp. CA-233914]|uniref:lanthionine synthetase LanC family protein n=1 Tax=Dactylosporangium sp. CA-233914 TaxID=3239934 RepID=UPI003D8B1DAD
MTYRELGEAAWAWVLGQVREQDGPWVPEVAGDAPAPDRDSLYAGIAGLAPVLAEIRVYRELTAAERTLADGIVSRLAAQAAARTEPSLFDGLAGDVTALRLLAPGREEVALRRLAELATPAGWDTTLDLGHQGPLSDVISGSAGIMLAAAWAPGGTGLLGTGGEALLAAAEPAEGGLDWRMWPGYRSSNPNFSHGTAGVATALALAGAALGRADLLDAARRGAEHLLAIAALDDGGFVLEHTIPRSQREVEPVTYTWCHGPTGTSLLFAALAHAGVESVGGYSPAQLRDRCLHSVLTSGVPQRLRPGFWDNDGRCCGTAGVGDALLDAAQDTGSQRYLDGARTMADALVERAIRDDSGARWRFIEYRDEEPLLPPRTTWMQGAAGIAAFLLRLARVESAGGTAPIVDRPDQWWAVPARLRLFREPSPAAGDSVSM